MTDDNKKCKNEGCDGQINRDVVVRIQTGCASYTPVSPCGKCGLLHDSQGDDFRNRATRKRPFLINGEIVHKK